VPPFSTNLYAEFKHHLTDRNILHYLLKFHLSSINSDPKYNHQYSQQVDKKVFEVQTHLIKYRDKPEH
jgi:hypothetical protein